MTPAYNRHRRDNNHAEIVSGLRQIGATVVDLSQVGGQCPDALIGWQGCNILLEIKSGKGKLSAEQVIWHNEWRGNAYVVRSLDEAIAALNTQVRR
jgi:hypothetical protein